MIITSMKVITYKKDAGFTLTEMIVTVIIAGILAAVAAPNFYGLLKSNEVNEGITTLENALKEAQKIAIRQSQACTVTINTATNSLTANPTTCLPTQRDIDADLNIFSDQASPFDIDFSYKGNTTNSYTIVVSSDGTTNVKCLLVSNGLGAMKVGEYTGSITGATPTINPTSCDATN